MEQANKNGLAVSVSVTRKVSLGRYESADVMLCVSGVTPDTSSKEIDAIISTTGALVYDRVTSKMRSIIKQLRAEESNV